MARRYSGRQEFDMKDQHVVGLRHSLGYENKAR